MISVCHAFWRNYYFKMKAGYDSDYITEHQAGIFCFQKQKNHIPTLPCQCFCSLHVSLTIEYDAKCRKVLSTGKRVYTHILLIQCSGFYVFCQMRNLRMPSPAAATPTHCHLRFQMLGYSGLCLTHVHCTQTSTCMAHTPALPHSRTHSACLILFDLLSVSITPCGSRLCSGLLRSHMCPCFRVLISSRFPSPSVFPCSWRFLGECCKSRTQHYSVYLKSD